MRRDPVRSTADYTFVSAEQFQRLIDEGELLEWAEIRRPAPFRNSGSTCALRRRCRRPGADRGRSAGARAVKAAMPEVTTVFLAPPSWEVLEQRLVGRGTESPEVQARRLSTAREEMAAQGDFDVVVVNTQLESACAELVSLLVVR